MADPLTMLLAKMDRMEQMLQTVISTKPALTQKEFAQLTHLHPVTVCKMVKRGRIKRKNGRIPYAEYLGYIGVGK